MRPWLLMAGLAAALPAVLHPWSGPAAAAEKIVADRESGCRIRDRYPDPRKTIRWAGQCLNGFAHGGGVLEWAYDGRPDAWAEGTFLDGRLEGEARIEWEDGRVLVGTFRRGLASGHGTHDWPDGRRYVGEWHEDRRTGFGTLIYPDGHRYVGEFLRNRPTGKGEFIASTGTRYAARVDPDGTVRPGAMLGADTPAPTQSAEQPARPGSLEEWLRQPGGE